MHCRGNLSTVSNSIVLISVYLPYQCPENEVEYLEKLGFINALTNEIDTTCFVITGDWNANLREGGNSLFAKHMDQLCDDNGFILFGFKRNHSTDQCMYVLKEIIDAYRVLNDSVFTCFFDASKAFDRVNHSILFGKLSNRGIPQYCYSNFVLQV